MTTQSRHDVVIVGARCAGATLATFLAYDAPRAMFWGYWNAPGFWRTDPVVALITDLASDSTTGPLIAGSTPDGRIRGTLKERYFFRRAAGNGWSLVGDAGHRKEFVIGDGITEALLQARSLASAIAQGTDAALHRWWRARDVEALPLFFLGQDEGALGPPMGVGF